MTRYEVETWARLWRRPEAIEWERLGMEDQVALYVRALRESAKLGAAAARTTTLLRQQNELGLSIAGRAANRWIIDDAPAPSAAPRRESTSTAKDRIRLLTGGKDARAS